MSRKTDAKKARRAKRLAAKDATWIPDSVLDENVDNLEMAEYLETFHELVTQRGWTYDDETSADTNVAWFYEPSVGDGEGTFTTMWISAEDDAEYVWLMLTGTSDGYRFEPDALIEFLDAIEAYRAGDPLPTFEPAGPSTTP